MARLCWLSGLVLVAALYAGKALAGSAWVPNQWIKVDEGKTGDRTGSVLRGISAFPESRLAGCKVYLCKAVRPPYKTQLHRPIASERPSARKTVSSSRQRPMARSGAHPRMVPIMSR